MLGEVRSLLGPAWIIEGEDPATYERLLAGVAKAIGPRDLVEWLLITDIVALTWEIQRSRRLSNSLTALYRREAMQTILHQLLPKPDFRSPLGQEHLILVEHLANGQEVANNTRSLKV